MDFLKQIPVASLEALTREGDALTMFPILDSLLRKNRQDHQLLYLFPSKLLGTSLAVACCNIKGLQLFGLLSFS